MTFYRQDNRKNCGQIAVANLTGIPLEEVTDKAGRRGCTKTKHLVAALHALGYDCPPRCRPMDVNPATFYGLAQLRRVPRQGSGWHWVAIKSGRVYDGHFWRPVPYEKYVAHRDSSRLTSFLPVHQI